MRTLILLACLAGLAQAQVRVVNMVPNSRSGETNQDSEPNLAVNPNAPQLIVGTAFTPDPMNGANAPIYCSSDSGNTWALVSIVPGNDATTGTGDITPRFGTSSNVLYAGILRGDSYLRLNLLRSNNFTCATSTAMTVLVDRNAVQMDQPFTQAATVLGGPGLGNDRVHVGFNFFSQNLSSGGAGRTASIYNSQNAATAAPPAGFNVNTVEVRNTGTGTCGQDGPQVRPAIHQDGTIYAVFYRWTCLSLNFPAITTDVVVVRDDNWGAGATPFTALAEPPAPAGDGQTGVRVVQGVTFTWNGTLGQERLGGDLSFAVDPRNSSTVYMVWADLQATVYTLHLRRSTDRGANWSAADLLTIANGKNPSLAINSHGKIAFLYQQVTGTVPNQRWETHVRRSTNGTTWTDVTLANVPSNAPASTFLPYIGDYAHLMAVGKDFYGVFSANNTPNNANFPSGVTYQRNANFTTNQLLDLSNNPVAVSIDPFFFQLTEVPPADDFYVRDWTDSPTSGDTGLEPSTHPFFYTTSDVWNRRGTLPGSFSNDQPANENAGNGLGNIGDNWAFARIRRNAAQASGSQTVTAHFLVSKLGTGSNYADAGSADPDVTFPNPDPTVTFTAADVGPSITAAYPWHLKAVTSTHLCLAVEISSPNDPFVAPSLVGNTPGWWTGTDLRVINDNNKAQRNMGLSTTPARGVGMSVTFYAIAHNGATFARSMRLKYVTPRNTRSQIRAGSVELIGGRTLLLKSEDGIDLPDMQPGENRWVGLTVTAPRGQPGDVLPVHFYETVGNASINGFTIAVRLADLTDTVRENLRHHRSVFTRMAAGFAVPQAEAAANKAYELIREGRFSRQEYLRFLRAQAGVVGSTAKRLIKSQLALDPFGVDVALAEFSAAVRAGNAEDAAATHITLLNKLDSFLTMRQLAKGDSADILQNVRWQRALFEELRQLRQLKCASTVRDTSLRFIAAYGERQIGNKEYPQLMRDQVGCFREAARSPWGLNLRLSDSVAQIERNMADLEALQGAHRNLLMKLQRLR